MQNNDVLSSKSAIPNKLLNADGTITDIAGNLITDSVKSYNAKPTIPNKFLNADGTYSTLAEIIAGITDGDIYVVVDELPSTGQTNKIYLVPDDKGGFAEYHWTGDKWDPVGMIDIDLSDYPTTQQMINAIEASASSTLVSSESYADAQIQGAITQVLGGSY